jgi:predicted PurR-regulated permease PerM
MQGEVNLRLTNRAIFLVLGALGLIWILFHATRIVVVLFMAVLLATAISSAANRLERYRVPRSLAILLTYLLVVGILAGVVGLLVPLIVNEVQLLSTNLPEYQIRADALLARFPQNNGQTLRVDDIISGLSGRLQEGAVELGRGVAEVGSVLVTLLLIFVFAFFMAVDDRFAVRIVRRFFPPAMRERAATIMGEMGDGLGQWVRAQLLLAAFFGIAFGIGLAILRVPYALTLAVVGTVLEVIPYIGGFVTVILAVLVAATTGKLWLVGATLVWYLLVVNVEAHIVGPKMVGDVVGLHPLVVVVALFIGEEVLGILGALLAVPIAVVLQILLDQFWKFGDEPQEAGQEQDRSYNADITKPYTHVGRLPLRRRTTARAEPPPGAS